MRHPIKSALAVLGLILAACSGPNTPAQADPEANCGAPGAFTQTTEYETVLVSSDGSETYTVQRRGEGIGEVRIIRDTGTQECLIHVGRESDDGDGGA